VTDAAAVKAAAEKVKAHFGRIDSVLFMAGTYTPGFYAALDFETIRRTVDINLMGALNTVSAALPVLTAQGKGQLVLCASVAGYRGLPNGQPYCATKAALISLAETLRLEHPALDVKVICPGFVKTPMTANNKFMMPMMVSAEDAAKAIIRGLQTRVFEIHFPKGFTLFVKLLRILPNPLFFAAAKVLAKVML
jgi:NAD(P)-dependent dehydrogenase (short-subunit alcohol dehydrogenase family)